MVDPEQFVVNLNRQISPELSARLRPPAVEGRSPRKARNWGRTTGRPVAGAATNGQPRSGPASAGVFDLKSARPVAARELRDQPPASYKPTTSGPYSIKKVSSNMSTWSCSREGFVEHAGTVPGTQALSTP